MKSTPWRTGRKSPTMPSAISIQPTTSTTMRLTCRSMIADLIPSIADPARLDAMVGAEVLEDTLQLSRRFILRGQFSSGADQVPVAEEVGESKSRRTPLADPGQFTRSAKLEVRLGDLESVVALADHLQPLSRILPEAFIRHQNAPRLAGATTNSATELVELGETEALRRFNDDHRRLRHINPHLNNCGRQQDRRGTVSKAGDRLLALRPVETTVEHLDPNTRQRLPDILLVLGQRRRLDLFTGIDDRVDNEDPTPSSIS